jgi:hypothetical protein
MTSYRSVRIAACFALVAAATGPASCNRDVVVGENRATLADAHAGGAANTGGAPSTDANGPCIQTRCQNHTYECGNCFDDDGDGLTDMDDPDCLGPCHNSESTFFGSIPGQNGGGCVQDCYFDQDSGSGNDDCVWSQACDRSSPGGTACSYDPNAKVPGRGGPADCTSLGQSQSAQCLSYCGPLTPNGCDCFGCCSLPGASTPIFMGSQDGAGNGTCDLAHVNDPTRCRPCTQVAGCLNPCDTCELCVGKRELPASCSEAGCAVPVCPAGLAPCGTPCLPKCDEGQICITGCCVREPH